MIVAYADPPYPGYAHYYRDHADYAGEVDHRALAEDLLEYDGWVLHTSSQALHYVQNQLAAAGIEPHDPRRRGSGDYRVMAWVKPFAAFKSNVSVAYAWEPVLVKACRTPVIQPGMTYRDWFAAKITLERGLAGVKPEAVCRWLFEVLGMERQDELVDLFPGSGAVWRAWQAWRAQPSIFDEAAS